MKINSANMYQIDSLTDSFSYYRISLTLDTILRY